MNESVRDAVFVDEPGAGRPEGRRLDGLARGARAAIAGVEFRGGADPVATRLVELGFVPGETVQMIAHGPFGADPLAVRLGSTRFALRREEASRVRLEPET